LSVVGERSFSVQVHGASRDASDGQRVACADRDGLTFVVNEVGVVGHDSPIESSLRVAIRPPSNDSNLVCEGGPTLRAGVRPEGMRRGWPGRHPVIVSIIAARISPAGVRL